MTRILISFFLALILAPCAAGADVRLPDSIVSVGKSKRCYVYDAAGNIIMQTRYLWSPATSAWVPAERDEAAFDAAGNNTLFVYYVWDADRGAWRGSSYYEYLYDEQRNVVQSWEKQWDSEAFGWAPGSHFEFAYDSERRQILSEGYVYDLATKTWVGFDKMIYAYDSEGHLIYAEEMAWGPSGWVGAEKYEYEFEPSVDVPTFRHWSAATDGRWRLAGYSSGAWSDAGRQWTIREYEIAVSGSERLIDTMIYFFPGSSGVDSLPADSPTKPGWRLEGRRIVLSRPADMRVCDLRGRLIMQAYAPGFTLPAPGVYVLTIGEESCKVAVK